jgi:2'-5' RNA ligase
MAMIGLKIPEEVSERLAKISLPGKKTLAEEMHITMFYFENKLSIQDVLKVVQAMYETTKKSEPIHIKGTTISTFDKGDDGVPIIIPIVSEDLISLRKKMAKKFDEAKIEYSKKWPEFKPHLTLSYSPKKIEDKKLNKSIAWKAEEIVFWAGEWSSDPGILVSMPLIPKDIKHKKASKFESSFLVAQLFEALVKSSDIFS